MIMATKLTKTTKKYKAGYIICLILSLALLFGPAAYYTIMAFLTSTVVIEKIALTTTLFIAFVMTMVSLINKTPIKCKIWIILLGIYICLDNIIIMLVIFAITQTIEELIVSPLKKSFKNKYTINKEIDKRQ